MGESLIPDTTEDVGQEIAVGSIKRRLCHQLRVHRQTSVQLIRIEEGYLVEISPFFPDDFDTDGVQRPTDHLASRREAWAFFRRVAVPGKDGDS